MKLSTALITALFLGTIGLGTGLAATPGQPATGPNSSPRPGMNSDTTFTCAQMNGRQGMGRLNQRPVACRTKNCRQQNNQAMLGRGHKGYGRGMGYGRQGAGRQMNQGCRVNNRQGMGPACRWQEQAMTEPMGPGRLALGGAAGYGRGMWGHGPFGAR